MGGGVVLDVRGLISEGPWPRGLPRGLWRMDPKTALPRLRRAPPAAAGADFLFLEHQESKV